jgi:hypothetical protein
LTPCRAAGALGSAGRPAVEAEIVKKKQNNKKQLQIILEYEKQLEIIIE